MKNRLVLFQVTINQEINRKKQKEEGTTNLRKEKKKQRNCTKLLYVKSIFKATKKSLKTDYFDFIFHFMSKLF